MFNSRDAPDIRPDNPAFFYFRYPVGYRYTVPVPIWLAGSQANYRYVPVIQKFFKKFKKQQNGLKFRKGNFRYICFYCFHFVENILLLSRNPAGYPVWGYTGYLVSAFIGKPGYPAGQMSSQFSTGIRCIPNSNFILHGTGTSSY
jgi:hypothetical protein